MSLHHPASVGVRGCMYRSGSKYELVLSRFGTGACIAPDLKYLDAHPVVGSVSFGVRNGCDHLTSLFPSDHTRLSSYLLSSWGLQTVTPANQSHPVTSLAPEGRTCRTAGVGSSGRMGHHPWLSNDLVVPAGCECISSFMPSIQIRPSIIQLLLLCLFL